jgi:neutral ceramidase
MALLIGAAKCKVDLTPAVGFNMQGFADENQKASGVGMEFYSRAFTVADDRGGRLAIAVVDLWACTEAIKQETIARLHTMSGGPSHFTAENVQVVGTHTHSGPAGISRYRLYNFYSGGFNEGITGAFAGAIAQSILDAHRSEAQGVIDLHRIDIEDCGRNRSPAAYRHNPAEERQRYGKETDTAMTVLDFRRNDGQGEKRIGILAWYPIHGTDLGQKNTLLHGDNKGVASHILEQEQGFCPIAAFANSNAGDVSGNVEYRTLPTTSPERALKHGKQQADAVMSVLTHPGEPPKRLSGAVSCRHAVVDMSAVSIEDSKARTYVPAIGLATLAGSNADSTVPFPPSLLSKGGLVRGKLSVKDAVIHVVLLSAGSQKDINLELLRYIAANNPAIFALLAPLLVSALFVFPAILVAAGIAAGAGVLKAAQKMKADIRAPSFFTLSKAERAGHDPKPITMVARGLVPSELPLQLMRIGDLAIAGVPGELTTMAGRRLRAALEAEYGLRGSPVGSVVISGYANAYSQYITTPEEYAMQHYEGASTLFGPHTLEAYIQEFRRLVSASPAAH